MPNKKIDYHHGHSSSSAVAIIKKEGIWKHPEIKDLKEEWHDNVSKFSFVVKGCHISGTLTVKKDILEINGDIPFVAIPFWGRIKTDIIKRLDHIFKK